MCRNNSLKVYMKKSLVFAAILCAFSSASIAEVSPWQVRVRAVHIDPANQSDPVGGVGAANTIHVSSKTIPEIDISYFFTPNWAAELILTYPQKHNVTLNGVNIGNFKQLPPTLTLQYHFSPASTWSPYVGAGINYTRISDVTLLEGNGRLDNHSIGFALQAGLDYKLDQHWSLNMDIKKVQISSAVKDLSGTQLSKVTIDPWLIGVGIGYRF
jgi:outer membrane protein